MPQFKPKTLRVGRKPIPAKLAAGTYETRMLMPGTPFQARKPVYESVLLATKKAIAERDPVDLPPPPPDLAGRIAGTKPPAETPAPSPAGAPIDERAALRAEYEAKLGKRPFPGWDIATLREKMAEA